MVKLCARVGTYYLRGFPGGSGDKASACNAGNPASIPRSGRSTGEGNGNPLRYSWKIPVTEELGNPLRYSWKIPVTEEFGGLQSMESQSRTRLKPPSMRAGRANVYSCIACTLHKVIPLYGHQSLCRHHNFSFLIFHFI